MKYKFWFTKPGETEYSLEYYVGNNLDSYVSLLKPIRIERIE